MHLEPARTVIEKSGGVDAVSKITGRSVSRVYRWMYSRERGGTGGAVPHGEARTLLDHAVATGGALTAADFFLTSASAPEAAA